ncbi:hypothetical protein J2T58_001664 [Methanocalculus alkaliphilus]|nr:hypothetical protein [Methanocalculus alkaliphilus]MCP1715793.1 hypothetical protein [Methanocalculus alkaliphilus]
MELRILLLRPESTGIAAGEPPGADEENLVLTPASPVGDEPYESL